MIQLALFLWGVVITWASQELIEDRQRLFDQIQKYELIHVNLNGFLSSNMIEFDAFNKHYKVQLTVNEFALPTLLHPNNDGSFTHHDTVDEESCYYHGKVLDIEGGSRVALSLCEDEGIRGTVHIFGSDEMFIHPTTYYHSPLDNSALTDEHLIYNNPALEEPKPGAITNTRRSLASGFNVELATLIDKNWVEYHGTTAKALSFFKGVVSEASSLSYNNNLPNDVRYSLTYRYAVFDDPQSCAGKTQCLYKGREYLSRINVGFDYGFYFVIDSDGGGLGYAAGSCKNSYKFGVALASNSKSQSGAARTLAHELGHNVQFRKKGATGHDDTGKWLMDPWARGATWSPASIENMRRRKNEGEWSCYQSTQGSGTVAGGRWKDNLGGMSGGGGNNNNNNNYNDNNNNGDSSNSASCIRVTDFQGDMRRLNGYYSWRSDRYVDDTNRNKYFKKVSGNYWTLNGGTNYGWCLQSSILSCSNDWDTSKYGQNLGAFRKSSECHALNMNDCFDGYAKTMCFNQGYNGNENMTLFDDGEDELQAFGLIEDEGCLNDKPVYGYKDTVGDVVYYIHKSDYGQWVLTDGTLMNDAPDAICEEDDLHDCIDGKWMREVDYDDERVLEVIEGAWIEVCSDDAEGQSLNEKSGSEVNEWMMLSIVLIVLLLFVFGAFIWYKHRSKNNKKGKFEIGNESEDDEVEVLEVTTNTLQ